VRGQAGGRDVYAECEVADKDVRSGPHAWIQWKGTDVCMDVRCSCGEASHVDADFAYYVKCPHCGKIWAMCANVRMIEVSATDIAGECSPREGSR
jgi:phage terminase large subunit GpA-like protein